MTTLLFVLESPVCLPVDTEGYHLQERHENMNESVSAITHVEPDSPQMST